MQMSGTGRQMLIDLEGFKSRVYHDSAGLPTIGVGHLLTQAELGSGFVTISDTGENIEWRNGISRPQVDSILAQDLACYEDVVNRLVEAPLQQNEFDALVSFCFNVGETKFAASTLLKRVNAGLLTAVPDEFLKWTKVTINGEKVTVKGLLSRRNKEIAMWRGELNPPEVVQDEAETEMEDDVGNQAGLPESQPQQPPIPSVIPRQYTPNKWLMALNPLDWLPGYGTYISIAATATLYVADKAGYHIDPTIGGVLAAFAAARLRRSITR